MTMTTFHFSDTEIDQFIQEDIACCDFTTGLLDIGHRKAKIIFKARTNMVVSGTEEACRIFEKLHVRTDHYLASGTQATKGEIIMIVKGSARNVHAAWRTANNMIECASGIATRAHEINQMAKKINPDMEICTTRKAFSGTRKIAIKAVISAGILPHRVGLSESILIFDEHIRFMEDEHPLEVILKNIRLRAKHKTITVEVHNMEDAMRYASLDIDIMQADRFSPTELKELVNYLKTNNLPIAVSALGGITEENIAEYSKTGAATLITSAPYYGKPADIEVELKPLW